MSGWLLDTNVISELRRPRPNRNVIEFIEKSPISRMHISLVTLAEIRKGIEATSDPARRASIDRWLARELRPMFEGRIVAVTEDVLLQSLLMVDAARKRRRPLSYPDLLMAATAVHHGFTMVTRNLRDFEHAGVVVLDPWVG